MISQVPVCLLVLVSKYEKCRYIGMSVVCERKIPARPVIYTLKGKIEIFGCCNDSRQCHAEVVIMKLRGYIVLVFLDV